MAIHVSDRSLSRLQYEDSYRISDEIEWSADMQVGYIDMSGLKDGLVATFLFTNTIFKKHKVLQTLLWMWLISFAINIILTPIMGIMMASGNWMLDIMASADPVATFSTAYWIAMAWSIVLTGVFYWWTWYRLKHMNY